jgi:hypothetical protein
MSRGKLNSVGIGAPSIVVRMPHAKGKWAVRQ